MRELSPAQLVAHIRRLERYCDEIIAERNRTRRRLSTAEARCEMLEESIAQCESECDQ